MAAELFGTPIFPNAMFLRELERIKAEYVSFEGDDGASDEPSNCADRRCSGLQCACKTGAAKPVRPNRSCVFQAVRADGQQSENRYEEG
jgi:hypothetical protein